MILGKPHFPDYKDPYGEMPSIPLYSGISGPEGVDSEADELACVREVLSRAGFEVLALSGRVSGDGWAGEFRWKRANATTEGVSG